VTILIAGRDVEGGDIERVVATVERDHEVTRAETLEAVREALPGCSAVVVGTLPSTSVSAVRETVRSGVYCPPTTPVVRLVPQSSTGAEESGPATDGYDGVVLADQPERLLDVLQAIDRTDEYRDAVATLYEACRANARGEGVDEAELSAAFERADRAYEELHSVAEWTPYERVFAEGDPASDAEAEKEAENEAGDDRESG
jgi:hypothetical protein